jgi:hypothetical protein
MAHFHITAVFETRGASQAECERVAAAAFSALRHPRLHYYEHDTSGGLGPYPPSQSLYFTTIAEFDAEAYTEEKAVEMAEDVLDRFSTDEIQYLGHGIIPGNQRVQSEDRRKTHEEGHRPSSVLEEESDERGSQRGKGRRPQRGRGRSRKPGGRDHENDTGAEERTAETVREAAPVIASSTSSDDIPPNRESPPVPSRPVRVARDEPAPVAVPIIVEEPALPPPPPPRSSAEMRVTLTVSLRASEVAQSRDQTVSQDDELIALAVAEARRRHSELPTEADPEVTTSSLPAGDRLISLTWHYQSPVPSAAELE